MQLDLFNWTHVHKLTGEKLRIKKIYGSVASCYIENPTCFISTWGKEVYYDAIVCSIDNLIEIK